MKRFWTIGLAVVFGLLAGSVLEASRSHKDMSSLGGWTGSSTPAVSAAPTHSARNVQVQYAADVEIEGERFRVYVGRSDGQGLGVPPIWSVAVPAED